VKLSDCFAGRDMAGYGTSYMCKK